MKQCEQCGADYARRRSEAFWQFEQRRFCSRKCADEDRRTTRVDDGAFKARYRQVTTPDGRKLLAHRYVMEQALGRPLTSTEQVHHRNHNRLDNRPENLEVLSSAEHGKRHTKHPTTKPCVICGQIFVPHKTKRIRAQTCGPKCKSALLSLRNAERKAS